MKLFLLLCLAVSALGCGIRLPKPISRHARAIIGGRNVTTPDKWPWQVLLVSYAGDTWACGATVISEQWIMTAGHCVTNNKTLVGISELRIFEGVTTRRQASEEKARKVIEIHLHPDYDERPTVNDIAVLKLAEPFTFDNVVSPICLPNPSQTIPDNGQAVVTGFGKTDVTIDGSSQVVYDGQLREAIVPIVNPEVCNELWSPTNTTEEIDEERFLDERKTPKLVCASSFDQGTHMGDSGGPLMMRDSSARWFQLGIASYIHCDSTDCEAPGDGIRGDLFPKTFTDVRKYCDWIALSTGGEVTCYGSEVLLEDVGGKE